MSKVLLIQPDPNLLPELIAQVQSLVAHAEVITATSGAEALSQAEAHESIDYLLTEIYLADLDGVQLFAYLRGRYPSARCCITTQYDLTEYLAHLQGQPVIVLPQELTLLSQHLSTSAEPSVATASPAGGALQGATVATFLVGKYIGHDTWGELYEAEDKNVHRAVYFTVLPTGASAEAIELFHREVALLARGSHPNVSAVYQAGEWQGHHYFARELRRDPTLADLAAGTKKLDARVVAHILNIVAQVLYFWEQKHLAHPPLTETAITLGTNSVVKVQNSVTTQVVTEEAAVDSLSHLVPVLRRLLPAGAPVPPPLEKILQPLLNRELTLEAVVKESAAVELALTPKKQIVASKEKVVAEKEITKSKSRNLMVILGGGLALLVAIIAVGWVIWMRLDPPMSDFNNMVRIPAGEFPYQEGGKTATTGEFWIDEYEVTLGQYLTFLKAVKGSGDIAKYLPPEVKEPTKFSAEPLLWPNIIKTIKSGQTWEGQSISLDYPVFNVSWFQAAAYAKWAGKRLPTEEEWEKAAALQKDGKTVLKFVWGDELDQTKANLGSDYAPGKPADGGKNDGFNGPSPVNGKKTDRSAFGVGGLTGNVSEWTASWSERLGTKVPVIRGASFASASLEKNALITRRVVREPAEAQQAWLGFRCVSDRPPAPSEKK